MRWQTGLCIVLGACLLLGARISQADRARARALVAEGEAFSLAGRHQMALERYEQAIATEPAYLQSYRLALPIWFRTDQLQTAQVALERLTLRCDECAFAWYALGGLYRKRGRFDLAVLAYQAYLAKRPRDADAYFGLAMALGATEDARTAPALEVYLRLEQRPERAAYRGEAQRLLAEISSKSSGAPTPVAIGASFLEETHGPGPGAATQRERIEQLVDDGQLASAEGLLRRSDLPGATALRLLARIAQARGLWLQAKGYEGIAWLMTPGSSAQAMGAPERP